MTHVVVVGAGQLGVSFCVLLDQWRQCQGAAEALQVTLIDGSPDILRGATRAAWIDHATGFEYFKRGEVETGRSCIQGSLLKRLILPGNLLDLPVPIRNRFFVSAEASKSGNVAFDEFFMAAKRAARVYRVLYERATRRVPKSEALLVLPTNFWGYLPRKHYHGVNEHAIAGGVKSAGGVVNMAMDVGFKTAAIQRAIERETVRSWIPCANIESITESAREVRIEINTPDLGSRTLVADYLVACAGSGIGELARHAGGMDLQGSYHLNFMVHAHLPPTANERLREQLASVNFVLQGRYGGMYACVVPPTATEPGLAAMFAPGYDASYIDEYSGRSGGRPPLPWEAIIRKADFPGRRQKQQAVLDRIAELNPFLRPEDESGKRGPGRYLGAVPPDMHRIAVGPVFNPHGEDRQMRRLMPPSPMTGSGRVLAMTTPKWTTAELAALTLLQYLLKRNAPRATLPTVKSEHDRGFGPYRLDLLPVVAELRLSGLRIDRSGVEGYLRSLGLPSRLLPHEHDLFR
jgi:hypothetical protein